MRLLISALAAAGIIGFSFGAYAADEPYTGQPKVQKPGRAIDDGAVKAPNAPKAAGREIDDGTVTTGKPKKFGREIDDGTVTSGKKLHKPGREVDDVADFEHGGKLVEVLFGALPVPAGPLDQPVDEFLAAVNQPGHAAVGVPHHHDRLRPTDR